MVNSGLLAEVRAAAFIIENNFAVAQPLDPKSRYDLIVDNGKRFFKVQVKSIGMHRNGRHSYPIPMYTRNRGRNRKSNPYTKEDVDMFVIHLKELNMWFVLPHDELHGKKAVTIYPHSDHLYDVYEDAWHLFDAE